MSMFSLIKKHKNKAISVLAAVIIIGGFGVVNSAGTCSANNVVTSHVLQCVAEQIAAPNIFIILEQDAALVSKLTGLLAVIFLTFSFSLFKVRKNIEEHSRLNQQKFHSSLPRSWPRMFTGFPSYLFSTQDP